MAGLVAASLSQSMEVAPLAASFFMKKPAPVKSRVCAVGGIHVAREEMGDACCTTVSSNLAEIQTNRIPFHGPPRLLPESFV